MMNAIRRSQMVGLITANPDSGSRFNLLEEVGVDDMGRAVYLFQSVKEVQAYQPGLRNHVAHTGSRLESLSNLRQLHRMAIHSSLGDFSGLVEDFLFDWETGEIAAYILGGDITAPFGGRALLYPENVEVIDTEAVVLREGAQNRLKNKSEGLKGFLDKKSQQVKNLVKTIGDRIHSVISPHGKQEVVRVKIKQVRDELETSRDRNKSVVQEAKGFLQDKWETWQQSVGKAGDRAQRAFKAAWKEFAQD